MGQHHLYVQVQDADGKGINDIPVEIRWETLRDGMEDYEYLWLLAGGDPEIGVSNAADDFVAQLVTRAPFSAATRLTWRKPAPQSPPNWAVPPGKKAPTRRRLRPVKA